jgi:hypothetical protein
LHAVFSGAALAPRFAMRRDELLVFIRYDEGVGSASVIAQIASDNLLCPPDVAPCPGIKARACAFMQE